MIDHKRAVARFAILLLLTVSMFPSGVSALGTGGAPTLFDSNLPLLDDEDDSDDTVDQDDVADEIADDDADDVANDIADDVADDDADDDDDDSSGSGNSGSGSSNSGSDDSIEDDSDDNDGEFVTVIDPDDDDSTDGFRDGQVVVRLQPGASIATFNERHGLTLVSSIERHELHLLNIPADRAIGELERELSDDPDTRWTELNYVNQTPEGRPGYFFVSGAPGSSDQSEYATQLLGYTSAHSCGTGTGIVVAVLDSGVDANHPALAGRLSAKGWNTLINSADIRDIGNGLDDDNDGLVDEMVGHGTHVAGIVAQVAPGATILPIKVLGSDGVGDAFFVAAGIHYAVDQGARIINLSLSSTYDSRVVAEAVAEASEAGVVVIAAAGNNATNRVLEFPAANTGVVGVAATDQDDAKSEFSNYGERIDLSAPGVDIVSALPGGLYASWSGTSMAAPFVAGAAALVAAARPTWSGHQIVERLLDRSDAIDDLNPGYTGELGAGRLDVRSAVNCQTG
jgi:subtilisin family serine protease